MLGRGRCCLRGSTQTAPSPIQRERQVVEARRAMARISKTPAMAGCVMELEQPAQWGPVVEAEGFSLQPHFTQRQETCPVAGGAPKLKVYVKCNTCGIEKRYANPSRLRRHLSGTAALCGNREVRGGMGGWKACVKVPQEDAEIWFGLVWLI